MAYRSSWMTPREAKAAVAAGVVLAALASAHAQAHTTHSSSPGGRETTAVRAAIAYARRQLGKPYCWGGTGSACFDCCLAAGSLVQTARGPVPIVDVQPGDQVYVWDDGRAGVSSVIARSEPRRQETFRLVTNRRVITASGNHPFHVVRPRPRAGAQASLKWVPLEEIRPGDYIVTLDHLPDDGTLPADRWLSNPSYLWLLGAMFADGHLLLDRISGHIFLCKFGEKRERMRQVAQSLTTARINDHPTHGLYWYDRELATALRRDGLSQRSTERVIPDAVWSLPHKLIAEFLDGYTLGDGSRSKRQRDPVIEYKAANPRLIEQVRNLHMILGHNVTKIGVIKRTKPIVIKGKTVVNAKPLHCFGAYENSSRKAHGYLNNRPAVAQLFPSDCFMPERVLRIEPAGIQDTYDIEVAGAHNFIADGINVHNSGLTMQAWASAGKSIPRTSEAQWADLRHVPASQRRAGDLVLAPGGDGSWASPGHVGLLIGKNTVIQAYSYGVPIERSSLSSFGSAAGGITGYVRP